MAGHHLRRSLTASRAIHLAGTPPKKRSKQSINQCENCGAEEAESFAMLVAMAAMLSLARRRGFAGDWYLIRFPKQLNLI